MINKNIFYISGTMPKCLNDKTKSYTGKEENPKGLGYSASGEALGTVMKGKDGNDYIVKGSEDTKKWILVKDGNSSKRSITESDNDSISSKSLKSNSNTNKSKNIKLKIQRTDEKSMVESLTSSVQNLNINENIKNIKNLTEEEEIKEVEQLYEKFKYEAKTFTDYENFHNKLFLYKHHKPSTTLANFFFSSLTYYDKDCLFTDVNIPIVSKEIIDFEYGNEPKFGGSKPYFIEGETWPEYDCNGIKKPFDFICQYLDPLNPGMMARLFLPLSSYEHLKKGLCYVSHVDYIPDDEKRIIIERLDSMTFPAYRIEKMKTKSEFKSFEYIEEKYKISPEQYEKYYDEIYHSYFNDFEESPYSGIKIGGTKVFSIESKKKNDNEEAEIQLTNCEFFNYIFGESNIVHICLNDNDEYVIYLNE